MYPRFDVPGNDIFFDFTGNVDAQQCQELCIDNPLCLSVEYVHEGGICFHKDITALTTSRAIRADIRSPTLEHYQRTCA